MSITSFTAVNRNTSKPTTQLTWILYPSVVVRVDANLVTFGLEGVLTVLDRSQLMLGVEIRPPPQLTVEDVRKALFLGNLAGRRRETKKNCHFGKHSCPINKKKLMFQSMHGSLFAYFTSTCGYVFLSSFLRRGFNNRFGYSESLDGSARTCHFMIQDATHYN